MIKHWTPQWFIFDSFCICCPSNFINLISGPNFSFIGGPIFQYISAVLHRTTDRTRTVRCRRNTSARSGLTTLFCFGKAPSNKEEELSLPSPLPIKQDSLNGETRQPTQFGNSANSFRRKFCLGFEKQWTPLLASFKWHASHQLCWAPFRHFCQVTWLEVRCLGASTATSLHRTKSVSHAIVWHVELATFETHLLHFKKAQLTLYHSHYGLISRKISHAHQLIDPKDLIKSLLTRWVHEWWRIKADCKDAWGTNTEPNDLRIWMSQLHDVETQKTSPGHRDHHLYSLGIWSPMPGQCGTVFFLIQQRRFTEQW